MDELVHEVGPTIGEPSKHKKRDRNLNKNEKIEHNRIHSVNLPYESKTTILSQMNNKKATMAEMNSSVQVVGRQSSEAQALSL